MSKFDIIRAWKDEAYRNSLSAKERSTLPKHPAGMIELGAADLENIAGGKADDGSLETHFIKCSAFCTFTANCPTDLVC